MFKRVKEDLIEAHEILTMPLMNCHSYNETDAGIGLGTPMFISFWESYGIWKMIPSVLTGK